MWPARTEAYVRSLNCSKSSTSRQWLTGEYAPLKNSASKTKPCSVAVGDGERETGEAEYTSPRREKVRPTLQRTAPTQMAKEAKAKAKGEGEIKAEAAEEARSRSQPKQPLFPTIPATTIRVGSAT